ncbi:MAG: hypothetical protein V7785_06990 [Bermanella sp.]
MKFYEFVKVFLSGAIPFFIWGGLLMAFYDFYPKFIQVEITDVFFESAAFKSIILLCLLSMFSAGAFLFIFGPYNQQNRVNDFSYRYFIVPTAKMGINFCSAAFGLILGFALVSIVSGYNDGVKILISCIHLAVIGCFCWFFSWIVIEENLNAVSSRAARWGGLFFIVITPFVGWFIYPLA